MISSLPAYPITKGNDGAKNPKDKYFKRFDTVELLIPFYNIFDITPNII